MVEASSSKSIWRIQTLIRLPQINSKGTLVGRGTRVFPPSSCVSPEHRGSEPGQWVHGLVLSGLRQGWAGPGRGGGVERGHQAPGPLPAWPWTFRGGSHPGSLPIVVFVADGGGLTGLQGAVGSWLRGPAGLSAGGSLGWQALPSPTWCHSTKAGLGSLACPHSLRPSFLLCCSCPTGSDRLGDFALNWLASPLRCPSAHSQYGEGTEPLAASDRNHSDRGSGEGRVGLAHGAGPLCPEALLGAVDRGQVGPGVGLSLLGACPCCPTW